MTRFAILLVGLVPLAAIGQPTPPDGLSNWSFDEITLANGAKLRGLILSEGPDGGMRFQSVWRNPGRPTVTFTEPFTRAEIASVKRLTDAERATLKERLAELDTSGEGEQKRMESLELVSVRWPGQPDGAAPAARQYDSDHFTLVSTGTEDLVRRSAVRLEQVYTAFARFLPPTVRDARPTQIMLAVTPDEYKALLGPLGAGGLLNPAVFDPVGNRVLCGSDLRRLGSELQTAHLHHSQQRATLDRYEGTVRKLYRKPELERYLEPIERERRRIITASADNGSKFDKATSRVFAVLYHEAFHAYAGTFVYPPLRPDDVKAGRGTGELPRWLNEGMAQVFETAVVEAGELRADWPDRDRLDRVQSWLKGKGSLVPLAELLASGKNSFLAAHADQKAAADRAYLTSWALAYYLTFQRRAIGTDAFRKYLVVVNSGGDPKAAFATLVEQDLSAFEKDWHDYLLRLRGDGSVGK